MGNPQPNKWTRETVMLMCPGCGTVEDFLPGRFNETRTIEYRRCEEGHVVEIPLLGRWPDPDDDRPIRFD